MGGGQPNAKATRKRDDVGEGRVTLGDHTRGRHENKDAILVNVSRRGLFKASKSSTRGWQRTSELAVATSSV